MLKHVLNTRENFPGLIQWDKDFVFQCSQTSLDTVICIVSWGSNLGDVKQNYKH